MTPKPKSGFLLRSKRVSDRLESHTSIKTYEMKTEQSGYGSMAFEWKDTHSVNHAMLLSLQSGYIFISNAGTYYFDCFVYGHCTSGQKLQLVIEEGRYMHMSCICTYMRMHECTIYVYVNISMHACTM